MRLSPLGKLMKPDLRFGNQLRFVVEVDNRPKVFQSYPLDSLSWLHFEQHLCKLVSCSQIKVKYKDEDGDEVNLNCEEEFQEALKVYRKINTFLEIRVTPIMTDVNDYNTIDEDGFPKPLQNSVDEISKTEVASATGCRPKDTATPPEWFTSYMEKFKGDLSAEAARKTVHRLHKQIAKEGLVISDQKDKKENNVHQGQKRSSSPPSLPPAQLSPPRKETCVHPGVKCDNCGQNVVGIRYKCGNCIKFDLCEICESLPDVHDKYHVFVKILRPATYAGIKKKTGKLSPLLKHLLYDDVDRTSDLRTEREKKLLKRLEKQTHKLEKYREKHRQRNSDRDHCSRHNQWDLSGAHSPNGQTHLCTHPHPYYHHHHHRHKHQTPSRGNENYEIEPSITIEQPEVKQSGFNPFTIDMMDAKFVRDETIPDGTEIMLGSQFVKRWRLINVGTQPWTDETMLKCVWGTVGLKPMEIEVAVPPLKPGEEGVVSVEFTAPYRTGHFDSHWRLYHQGQRFGHRIWCSVTIIDTPVAAPQETVVETKTNATENVSCVDVDKVSQRLEVQEPENGEKEQFNDKGKCNEASQRNTAGVEHWEREISRVVNDSAVLPTTNDCTLKPQCGSITATPNNTPRDLTPPKSPDPEEIQNQENLMSELTMVLEDNDFPRSDYPDDFLSEASVESDFGGSLVSLSSTDSDLGYVVVPMPSCFNLTVPAVAVHGAPNIEEDSCKLADKEENSSVTTATDSDEELTKALPSSQTQSTVAGFNSSESEGDNSSKDLPNDVQSKTETNREVIEAESGENLATNFQRLSLQDDSITVESKIVADGPSTPIGSQENPEKIVPTVTFASTHCSSDRMVPILPEPIMTAAASVFNSARDIFQTITEGSASTNANKFQKATAPSVTVVSSMVHKTEDKVYPTMTPSMKQLYDMGFCNRELNEKLLAKHGYDVNKVVGELVGITDNEWFASRH